MNNCTNNLDFNFPKRHKSKSSYKKLFIFLLFVIIAEVYLLFISNDPEISDSIKNLVEINTLVEDYENNLALNETPLLTKSQAKIINQIANDTEKTSENTSNQTNNTLINKSNIISKSTKIKSGDNLYDIFAKLKLPINDLYQILKIKPLKKHFTNLIPGQEIDFELTNDHKINKVTFVLNHLKQLVLTKEDNKYSYDYITEELEPRINSKKILIKSSLYDSIVEAKLPLHFLIKIADIFSWDIDFTTDLRTNDSMSIVYEEMYLNDEKYSYGDILAVKFKNNKNTYHAIKYTNGKSQDYYTPQGYNLKKAFIRTPVKHTRISSYFTVSRNHPILHKIRSHKGVDYAAPYGTPIKAAGDGKVNFVGRKGGYGKAIILQHGNGYTTLYGHLSKYKKGIVNNKFLKQGDIIGYVGSTGLATGPHLHFEFRVNGVHKDPLTVKLPRATPISKKIKKDFDKYSKKIIAKLDSIDNDKKYA